MPDGSEFYPDVEKTFEMAMRVTLSDKMGNAWSCTTTDYPCHRASHVRSTRHSGWGFSRTLLDCTTIQRG
jgi:hypothetical protein